MLYKEHSGEYTPWSGERINGILYSLNIEQLWDDADLEKINLYRPHEALPIPDNKVVVSTTVEKINGIVMYVHQLEDYIEPIPEVVSKRQAKLILHSVGLLTSVVDAINNLSEPDKTIAQIEWDNATEFRRDHGVLSELANVLGLTKEQIDGLFIQASKL